jgi:ABC-type dipeptide/oligopeptide/nickel transport system ATPase component
VLWIASSAFGLSQIPLIMRNLTSPFSSPLVQQARQKARRANARPRVPKSPKPVTRDILEALLATCDDSHRGNRDRAMLMLAFASGGRRRSEVTALNVEDIGRDDFEAKGLVWIRLLETKTTKKDQAPRLPMKGRAARDRAVALLEQVEIPDAARRLQAYPHELSGGMNQRVMIAMAIACGPKLLIADEPTTALDVTLQLQILHLLKEKQKALNTSMILVTHDMGVAANMCDELLLLQKGHLQEKGPTNTVLKNPQSQYAQTLLSHIPTLHHTSH